MLAIPVGSQPAALPLASLLPTTSTVRRQAHRPTNAQLARRVTRPKNSHQPIQNQCRGSSNAALSSRMASTNPHSRASCPHRVPNLIPVKSDLAGAIRYARSRWDALTRYLDDGRLEISNNAAENQIRLVALGRKNWLFSGSDAGGERAAAFYTLIRTARLNGVEPEAWLSDVIARIGAHPINRLAELLPWNWSPPATHLGQAERRHSVAA